MDRFLYQKDIAPGKGVSPCCMRTGSANHLQNIYESQFMHYFTSVTTNYIPKARVLAESVKRHNKDAVFHLMLSDDPPESFDIGPEPFDSLIRVEDLGIENLSSWIFRHSVVELCTAVKGACFVHIMEKHNADKVIYFDPDIVVLSELSFLSGLLDQAGVLLTPHQVEPEKTTDAILDNEVCSLKHGVYNLGFLGAKNNEGGRKFLSWWKERLLAFCYDDIPNGLFTDQKWADLAPAFFDDIHIIRDKTCNVATWNLTHRDIRADEKGNLTISGRPVLFFHFSGFDSGDQETMLRKYAKDNNALFAFRKWYIRELEKKGQKELGKIPSKYGFYSNNEPVRNSHRILYRSRNDLICAFPDPFYVNEDDKICYYYWLKETFPAESGKEPGNGGQGCAPEGCEAQRLVEMEEEIQKILDSTSWRITRPIRNASIFFQKYLGRNSSIFRLRNKMMKRR